jgi:hypothetical protein
LLNSCLLTRCSDCFLEELSHSRQSQLLKRCNNILIRCKEGFKQLSQINLNNWVLKMLLKQVSFLLLLTQMIAASSSVKKNPSSLILPSYNVSLTGKYLTLFYIVFENVIFNCFIKNHLWKECLPDLRVMPN